MQTDQDTVLSVSTARARFSDLVGLAAFAKARTIISRRGKRVAAIVPLEDIELLELIEEKLELDEARAALTEARRKGTRPWAEIKAELGL